MANEERDVPDLLSILGDINGMQERLDKVQVADSQTPDGAALKEILSFLKNDLVPLVKDFVESSIISFEDIQDEINPIKLTGADAKEALTIFQATLQTNPQLTERISPLIEALSEQLGEGDDDEADSN